ncbi:MAG: cache domain-containing protein [Gammaproteobacteria bacterium]
MSDSVMAAAKSHLAQGKFFGLRWKSFLWLSLLLLALSSVFYVLSYHELYRQFQAREQADIHFLRHHIQGLFTGSSDRLTRLGGALVTMSDIREALRSQSKKQIEKLMSGYYASLGYELDMRQIELYANDGSRVGHWASFGEKEIPEAFYRFAIASVQREEKPITLLHCHPNCLLYAFVPILASGENVGVIALGQSIADFIIDFNLITGANLALVIPDDNSGGTMLPPWRSRIPALTNTDKLQPLLQHLANRYSKPDALDRGLIIAWNRAYYDIYRIPLQEIIPGQAGFILLITDVSSNIQDIHSALRQELLTTLASLLLAEMILIYLIRAPLRRLSQLSLHLPLLAQGHHAQARR